MGIGKRYFSSSLDKGFIKDQRNNHTITNGYVFDKKHQSTSHKKWRHMPPFLF